MVFGTGLFLAVVVIAAEPKPGDEGTPEFAKAAGLIKQLGHPQFAAREAAAKELVGMGGAAVPALRAGTRSDDEEVRSRCTALLPQATAIEWKRRADAYLADTDGRQKHDLPLLDEWDRLIGKPDPSSRMLFAELIRSNGQFLETVASDRTRAANLCAARSKALLERVQEPKGQAKADIGDLAAALFVDALEPALTSRERETMPACFLRNPAMDEAVVAAETGPGLRRHLARWADAFPGNDPTPLIEFADLARRKPFPEATPVLVKVAKDKTSRWLVLRLLAVEALGAVGGKDAAAALAELVPDETVMLRVGGPDGPEGQRFGEQALAASLALHGKRPEDFGLTATKMRFVRPVGRDSVPLSVYGFPDAGARRKAIQRWKAEVFAKGTDKK